VLTLHTVRIAVAPLVVGALAGALWHTYHPIAAAATINRSAGVMAIELTDRATLPVKVEGLEIDGRNHPDAVVSGWWSSSPQCEHRSTTDRRWVWRRRVWWCLPMGTMKRHSHEALRLDYSVLGIPQSLVIR
jgi:hypothetical protein